MAITNFDYNLAIQQANRIDAVAGEMKSVADNEMQSSLDSLNACWRGEASRQFINCCVATQADIKAQAGNLQNIAGRIREAANILKDIEDRARAVVN